MLQLCPHIIQTSPSFSATCLIYSTIRYPFNAFKAFLHITPLVLGFCTYFKNIMYSALRQHRAPWSKIINNFKMSITKHQIKCRALQSTGTCVTTGHLPMKPFLTRGKSFDLLDPQSAYASHAHCKDHISSSPL